MLRRLRSRRILATAVFAAVAVGAIAAAAALAWRASGDGVRAHSRQPSPCRAPATRLREPNALVFQAGDGYSSSVYAVGLADGATRELRDADVDDTPVVSPDGRRIAYVGTDDALRVTRRDSRAIATTLLSREDYSDFESALAWSPGSDCVAFALHGGIRVLRVGDGRRWRLGVVDAEGVSWSPDGRLAYGDSKGISISRADGSGRTRLVLRRAVGGPGVPQEPAWSPTGEQVAFIVPDDEFEIGGRVFVVRSDGSGLRRVVSGWYGGELDSFGLNVTSNLAWAPDGRSLAVVTRHGAVGRLELVDLDTGRRRVLIDRGNPTTPLFSPDGRSIAYVVHEADTRTVHTIDVATKRTRLLTAGFQSADIGGWSLHALPRSVAPPSVVLPVSRELRPTRPIEALAAAGGRVALKPTGAGCEPTLVWNGETGVSRRLRGVSCRDLEGFDVALTDDSLVTSAVYAPPMSADTREHVVRRIELDSGRSSTVASATATADGGDELGKVGWNGNEIVYERWSVNADYAVLGEQVVASREDTVRTLADEAVLVAAGADGVVVRTGKRLRLVRGRARHDLPAAVGAAVGGGVVATLGANGLLHVYDAETGRERSRWRAAAPGETADLLDVDAGVAALAVSGRLELLRLADGRRVRVRLPAGAARVRAQLDRGALVHSYEASGGPRVAYVTAPAVGRVFETVR